MNQTIFDWLAELRLQGKSEATLTGYGGELRRLAGRYPGKCAMDFKRADLMQYFGEAQLRGCQAETVKRTVVACKNFFGWVFGKSKSPAAKIPMPKVKKKKQRTPKPEELLRVLSVCG